MICLLAATAHETARLRQQLPLSPDPRLPGQTFSCRFANEEILLLHTGIGIVSAAISLTRLLERSPALLLIAFGCGGSYPASGLKNGDLALATGEYFVDLGAATREGFLPLENLGLAAPTTEWSLFAQQLRFEPGWVQAAQKLLQQAPELKQLTLREGIFATVNTVSGTAELSTELERRSAAICENMEGAALAQVAASYGIPLLELRGISNPCGTRERSRWDLPLGMKVAQKAVLRLLKELSHLRSLACG